VFLDAVFLGAVFLGAEFLGTEFLGTERPFSEPAGNSFFGMRSTFTETGLGRLSLTESQPVRDTSLGIKNVGGAPKNYPAQSGSANAVPCIIETIQGKLLVVYEVLFPLPQASRKSLRELPP